MAERTRRALSRREEQRPGPERGFWTGFCFSFVFGVFAWLVLLRIAGVL